MRRGLQTFVTAGVLAVATYVVVPAPKGSPAAEPLDECGAWRGAYGSVVPPDLWGKVTDGHTGELSTTSDIDPEAVDEVLAWQPENCPAPEPPPGAAEGGGWKRYPRT